MRKQTWSSWERAGVGVGVSQLIPWSLFKKNLFKFLFPLNFLNEQHDCQQVNLRSQFTHLENEEDGPQFYTSAQIPDC